MDLTNYIVERSIYRTHFSCDLSACKGACCTFPGGSGAPLMEEEIPHLERALPVVRKYLQKEHLDNIERHGLVERHANEVWVRCINDEACIFVMYEGNIAKCSIQHAFYKGELNWIKPQSCHLFPIRVSGKTRNTLKLESFSECESAFEKGDRDSMPLLRFLDDALERSFGTEITQELQQKVE